MPLLLAPLAQSRARALASPCRPSISCVIFRLLPHAHNFYCRWCGFAASLASVAGFEPAQIAAEPNLRKWGAAWSLAAAVGRPRLD